MWQSMFLKHCSVAACDEAMPSCSNVDKALVARNAGHQQKLSTSTPRPQLHSNEQIEQC
jgi:hypothetical protein